MSRKLVDLHCHILPGVDDGAKNIDVTAELLRQEIRGGVSGIMLTPHFYYERDKLESFALRREEAYRTVQAAIQNYGFNITCKLGAEVYFSTALPSLDLDVLAFEGTNYILIELPTNYHPGGIDEVLYDIQCAGYAPIIAHVERYSYVAENPVLLYEWVNNGALAHINASPLLRAGKTARLVKKYIDWGLVHFICSDAHSPDRRPANLSGAFKALPDSIAESMQETAEAIFDGEDPFVPEPHRPRKIFGKWF